MIKCYREAEKCILDINEDRIILSNPSVQPFNEYIYDSKDDILYFYYDIEWQHNTEWSKYDELKKEKEVKANWVTCAVNSVYEFGAIRALSECVDDIIRINPDENGQKDYLFIDKDTRSETDYESTYEISCTGMLKEDSYRLKKIHKHFASYWNEEDDTYGPKDLISYEVYIGLGGELQRNTIGIMSDDMTEDDVLIIKAWADDFMELTKSITLACIERMFNSDEDKNYYNPKWLHDHIKETYPEDINQWKEIWKKLYSETFILEEYWNYVKGNEIESPYFSKWTNKRLVAQDLIKDGRKDWEAYCQLIDFYHEK